MSCRVLIAGVSGFVGGAARAGSVDVFRAHDLTRPLPADRGRFDAVVHAAALSAPWGSPAAFQAQNVDATPHMLSFARASGSGKFVFISSSSAYYRHGDQLGITEETPFPERPINRHAATKVEGERLVRESGLETVILRPRAVFGPGDTVVFPRIRQGPWRAIRRFRAPVRCSMAAAAMELTVSTSVTKCPNLTPVRARAVPGARPSWRSRSSIVTRRAGRTARRFPGTERAVTYLAKCNCLLQNCV